jgi:hypothetical protein
MAGMEPRVEAKGLGVNRPKQAKHREVRERWIYTKI